MIYLVVVFALLAVLISWLLIEMGISDSDNVSTGLGVVLLVVVIITGVCFYLGNKIPLVVVSLMIGLPMCFNACKTMAACPKESPYSTGDKIIGMSYWLFTMLFLAIAFYYWYYIPERVILPIIMGAIALIACAYAIYWFAKQKSYFLPMMTAVIFAAIVLYFSNVRGTLTSNPILEYSMLAVLFLVGMRFLFAMVMAFNKMHEPIEKWTLFWIEGLELKSFFLEKN